MPNDIRIATWNKPTPAPQQTLPQFVYANRFAFALTCGVPIVVLSFGVFPSFAIFCAFFGGTAAVTGTAMWVLSASRRNYGEYAKPLPKLEHGDKLPRIIVILRFEVDGYPYGEDRGELTVVDSWLVFEGERTSFSVSPEDVTDHRRLATENWHRQISFGLKATDGKVRVRMKAEDDRNDPGALLDSWTSRTAESPRISVLPPLEALPGFRRGNLLYNSGSNPISRATKFAAVLAPAVTLVLTGFFHRPDSVFIALGLYFALVLVLNCLTNSVRRRSLRALATIQKDLCASPLSQGLPPIPPLRAMRLEEQGQSVTQQVRGK